MSRNFSNQFADMRTGSDCHGALLLSIQTRGWGNRALKAKLGGFFQSRRSMGNGTNGARKSDFAKIDGIMRQDRARQRRDKRRSRCQIGQ